MAGHLQNKTSTDSYQKTLIGFFFFYQKTHCFLNSRQKIVNRKIRITNHDSRAIRAVFRGLSGGVLLDFLIYEKF